MRAKSTPQRWLESFTPRGSRAYNGAITQGISAALMSDDQHFLKDNRGCTANLGRWGKFKCEYAQKHSFWVHLKNKHSTLSSHKTLNTYSVNSNHAPIRWTTCWRRKPLTSRYGIIKHNTTSTPHCMRSPPRLPWTISHIINSPLNETGLFSYKSVTPKIHSI